MMREKKIPKEAAIEIMVLNPDPAVHHNNKSVHENLWIKERFGKENYLSIGVMLKEGTSELQYYFFEDCDKNPKFYPSLEELKEDLPPENDIFDRTHKVYLMGHGDNESKYGFGNYHAHDDFNHLPDDTEQIYGDDFDKLIKDILITMPANGITLEQCHADNLVAADTVGYTKSFLERLSAKYQHITFSGTGPWSDSKNLQESIATDSRASGGYPNLNAPITSTGGGIWKHGNTVIFHHNKEQMAVRKSPFASTETAKSLKINTVNYARAILNPKNLTDEEREKIISRICANRKILKIEDLKHESAFPHKEQPENEKITKLMENEKLILKQEQDRYLQRVQAILLKDTYSDRDVLMIALGLNHPYIFNGRDDILQEVLKNENLLKLVMVSCGKVLLAAQDNNTVINLLVQKGISINSVDKEGMTALHYAANNFYVYRTEPLNLVKKLLTSGANIDARDKNGQTPLTLAAEQNRKKTVMGGDSLLQLLQLVKTMKEADIPGVAMAFVDKKGTIKIQEIGVTKKDSTDQVTSTTIFGAASLSKSVFSYLTLKLVQGGILDLEKPLNDILSFENFCDQFCQEYNCQWEKTTDDIKRAQSLNVKMILSHTTGFDLFKNKIDSRFNPGTEYRYSGLPLMYLQKVIEKLTHSTLEELAKKYVFEPLEMKHSSFYDLCSMSEETREPGKFYIKATKNGLVYEALGEGSNMPWHNTIPWHQLPKDFPRDTAEIIQSKGKWLSTILVHASKTNDIPQTNAANSLFTTAEDYAKFIKAWMNDETLKYAFEPIISMTKDDWAVGVNVPFKDLRKLACGMGFELEENGKDNLPLAYKTGDMNQWRGFVAIDLDKKKAVVYFANAKNGHILAHQIITPQIKLEHALKYFSQKYGFAIEPESDWQKKEKERFDRIGKYLDSRNNASSQHKKEATQPSISSHSIFQSPAISAKSEKESDKKISVHRKKGG